MKQYLVLDFGGTYTKYALMDENGAFLERGNANETNRGRPGAASVVLT